MDPPDYRDPDLSFSKLPRQGGPITTVIDVSEAHKPPT